MMRTLILLSPSSPSPLSPAIRGQESFSAFFACNHKGSSSSFLLLGRTGRAKNMGYLSSITNSEKDAWIDIARGTFGFSYVSFPPLMNDRCCVGEISALLIIPLQLRTAVRPPLHPSLITNSTYSFSSRYLPRAGFFAASPVSRSGEGWRRRRRRRRPRRPPGRPPREVAALRRGGPIPQ